jgi:hypothetical protein
MKLTFFVDTGEYAGSASLPFHLSEHDARPDQAWPSCRECGRIIDASADACG